MASSNILITGGAGYIGSHIALELFKENHNVYIIDNFSNSSKKSLDSIKKISGKEVKFYKGDLKDNNFLDIFFKNNKIDCVIHCAGMKSVAESFLKPHKYYENNIVGTINLLSIMKKNNIKKIIFSSSATVYCDDEKMPVSELSKIGFGNNPYAKSKVIIENYLKDLHSSDPEWSIIILRYFNPIGNDPSCELGENPIGIANNLMPLINRAAFKKSTLIIFGNDYDTKDGTPVRDYIHVSDLAKGHTKSINYLYLNKGALSIFNLGNGIGVTVMELIKVYEKVNNIEINYKFGERRKGDLAVCYADNSNAIYYLNWTPIYNIKEMCIHSYQWIKKNLNELH